MAMFNRKLVVYRRVLGILQQLQHNGAKRVFIYPVVEETVFSGCSWGIYITIGEPGGATACFPTFPNHMISMVRYNGEAHQYGKIHRVCLKTED